MEMTLDEVMDWVANSYTKEKNTLKVVEECLELTEVLVKTVTKDKINAPSIEKVVEEMGDVYFRLGVLAKVLDIEERVQTRIQEKSDIMEEYLNSKYNK